jgi:phospholipid-binding lipoprotein MlaA
VKDDPAVRNSLLGVHTMHFRAALLPADRIIEGASWDKYAYIRSAYLQRRAAQNGRPTPIFDDDDDLDEQSNEE